MNKNSRNTKHNKMNLILLQLFVYSKLKSVFKQNDTTATVHFIVVLQNPVESVFIG